MLRPFGEEEKKKFEETSKKEEEFQEVQPSKGEEENGESFKKEQSVKPFNEGEEKRPSRPLCNWSDPNILNFRTADGTCNNLFTNPRYGQSGTIFQRILPNPSYQDGNNIDVIYCSIKHDEINCTQFNTP